MTVTPDDAIHPDGGTHREHTAHVQRTSREDLTRHLAVKADLLRFEADELTRRSRLSEHANDVAVLHALAADLRQAAGAMDKGRSQVGVAPLPARCRWLDPTAGHGMTATGPGTVIGYYGSKRRLADRIVAMLPDHTGYVEPFAGSLAVLMAKPPARFEVANDLDGDLVNFWRVLRDRRPNLERACALTPHSRAEAAAWPIPDDVTDPVERARRTWTRLTQGRGGSMRPTGWRYHETAGGRPSSMPRTLAGYVGRFAGAADRLAGVTLECLPALEVIDRYGRDRDALLYVDPPYLASTRNSAAYRHEMPTDDEHRDLAKALHQCAATVVLSGYPSPLYDDLYAGWDRAEIRAATRQGNKTGEETHRTEVLWCSRRLRRDASLFDGEDTA